MNQSMDTPETVIICNRFVRSRNVLLSEVNCAPLFEAMGAHHKQHGIKMPTHIAPLFKDLLVAFTLHCASRPRNELMAWTIRYSDPLVSFFFGGDTQLGIVTGRYFDQFVKEASMGEMHQELHRPNRPPHMSVVEFSGNDAQSAIHEFYEQSEQRPAKFYPLSETSYALVSAHPDYDEGWFTNVTADIVRSLPETETLSLIETRSYRWQCGCSYEKILEVLVPMMKENPASIFGDDDSANVNCPRCGANYRILREDMIRKCETSSQE